MLNETKLELLKTLCQIRGTSGDEGAIHDFLLHYVSENQAHWKTKPKIWTGRGFKDNLTLIFGSPKKAFYAHMDTVGYTIRYDNHIIPIGGPDGKTGDLLEFEYDGQVQKTRLIVEEDNDWALVDYPKTIDPGTVLTYAPIFENHSDWIKSPYLDDRLGVWALLQMAENLEDAALVFSTYEEHGGGGAGILARILYEKYEVTKSLIVDVTWISEGVSAGKGPVISLRDSRIPRKKFVDEIRSILDQKGIGYQLEVESHGGSDGREIQHLPYPIDWCFIGPPSENPHSSQESVHKKDVEGFLRMLEALKEI